MQTNMSDMTRRQQYTDDLL